MAYEQILFTKENGVATITFNRPDALNAITPKMLEEAQDALEDASVDDDVGVVVLTGAGRAFSAGVDIKALGNVDMTGGSVGPRLDDPARHFIDTLVKTPKVVIAKINGFCFTGALEIALGCDLVYVAEEAKLGDTHTKYGLRPTWGMSARLPRAVGWHAAKELSFTSSTISGRDAAVIGLANRVVPLEKLDQTVEKATKMILANSREAIAAYKRLYQESAAKSLAEALEYERKTLFDIKDTNQRLAEFTKKS